MSGHSHTPAQQSVHSHELHAHKAGDAIHSHAKEITSQKVLTIALVITLGFAVVEVFAGIYANSLALISDAGHMVTDAAGLIALVIWISFEAIHRFKNPHLVGGQTVTVVAALGLFVNILVAWMLSRNNKSMNTRAALVHVMGDLLGSVAALAAGLVIQYTGWMEIDPILSLVVCLLLIKSTVSILKESYHFLMKGVPVHIDYVMVGDDLKNIPGVIAVHDLHVWEMTPGFPALIGHIEVSKLMDWPQTMDLIREMLLSKHGIDHVTLQPEIAE